ncbi:MAG: hypothetical protein IJV83_01500 [Clostridia bacterium]|nr:hypothetical protein [Clostridia bacterium]
MAKLKKAAALLTSLLLCTTFLTTVACNKNGDSSDKSESSSFNSESSLEEISSSESESSENESSGNDSTPEETVFTLEDHTWDAWETVTEKTCQIDGKQRLVCTDDNCGAIKTRTIKAGHVWGEWTGSTENLCTEDATLIRECEDCDATDSLVITKRGHSYVNNQCSICNEPFVFPALNETPTFTDVWNDSVAGAGESFNRKHLQENIYYSLEVPASNKEDPDYGVWISVPVSEPGQYALLTIGGTNGVSIDRFDATDHYIPINDNFEYIGFPAMEDKNGESYSLVNCTETYWSSFWRATWRFSANVSATVKFVVVKIAPPVWTPKYLKENAIPSQINHVKANDPDAHLLPVAVDYNAEYYFDEWNEVYRLGTKENPGDVIYAAITMPAARLLGEKSFTTITEDGDNLSLFKGYDVYGNYLIMNYMPFIMKDHAINGNCYENYVNKDGLYPVTQELYDFIQLYITKNKPFDIPDSIWGDEEARQNKAWLASCYYYKELKPGTEENPFLLTGLGDFEATPPLFDMVYFTIKYTDESGAETVRLKISCQNENAVISINGQTHYAPFDVEIEVDCIKGTTFFITSLGYTEETFQLTLSQA